MYAAYRKAEEKSKSSKVRRKISEEDFDRSSDSDSSEIQAGGGLDWAKERDNGNSDTLSFLYNLNPPSPCRSKVTRKISFIPHP